jgi:hypothetical protein
MASGKNHNITSTNAESVMTVEELFPGGFILEQFSTDQAVAAESIQVSETRMGVDGNLVAGYTPAIHVITINLEASSPSTAYLNQLYDAMAAARTMYKVSLVSTVPSIETVFRWLDGFLQTATPSPAQKKILDPTSWTFHFAKFERSGL